MHNFSVSFTGHIHKYDYDWVVSIEIAYHNKRMFIFYVYLPCDNQDNEDEYLDRLTKLHNIVSECDSSCISIVGNFNANVKTNANFAVLVKEACEQLNYVWTSCKMLPNDTYNYVSDAWVVAPGWIIVFLRKMEMG